MCQPIRNSADRKMRRAAACFLLLYLVCERLSLRYSTGLASMILAGCAGAFLFGQLFTLGWLVVRLRDEFQRVLLMRSFIWATVLTMGFALVWGSVEDRSGGAVGHLPLLILPVILICVTAAAKLLIFRRYRVQVE